MRSWLQIIKKIKYFFFKYFLKRWLYLLGNLFIISLLSILEQYLIVVIELFKLKYLIRVISQVHYIHWLKKILRTYAIIWKISRRKNSFCKCLKTCYYKKYKLILNIISITRNSYPFYKQRILQMNLLSFLKRWVFHNMSFLNLI